MTQWTEQTHRPERRSFLARGLAGAAWLTLGSSIAYTRRALAAPITVPALPYAEDALAPVISAQTIGFHYGKHHMGYASALNDKIAGTDLAAMPLEAIVKATAGKAEQAGVFNAAAQVWNHTFFWQSMAPTSSTPDGALAQAVERDFGGLDNLKQALLTAATSQFGSGWAWLVVEQGKLGIMKTPNAETPLTGTATPLLTIDVWEHAYYLDYQNRRADYVKAVMDKLLNWRFAADNFAKAA